MKQLNKDIQKLKIKLKNEATSKGQENEIKLEITNIFKLINLK